MEYGNINVWSEKCDGELHIYLQQKTAPGELECYRSLIVRATELNSLTKKAIHWTNVMMEKILDGFVQNLSDFGRSCIDVNKTGEIRLTCGREALELGYYFKYW